MHCHVLPGVDDGAGSMEETLEILQIAADEGITDMIVTPHYKSGRHNAGAEKIMKLIARVEAEAGRRGIDIALYPGNEILYFNGLEEALETGSVLTLNGTNRVLVEFTPSSNFTYVRNALDGIRGIGFVPVVAHAERYDCMLTNPENVKEVRNLGAEIQINAASVIGDSGRRAKKLVHQLLADKLVDYVGTDAHNAYDRTPEMEECFECLYRKYDEDYVDEITFENALSLINAE